MVTPRDADDERIRETLKLWRQGDCVIGDYWFLYRTGDEQNESMEDQVFGLMVLTQTCDIVRSHRQRPFIEVCPLVKVEPGKPPTLREVKRCRRPNYAFVPSLEEQRLVADLDRVMTVEKCVLVNWDRTEGCVTKKDRQRLAQALARKRSRVAFPDDFVDLVSSLGEYVDDNHGKNSPEGKALDDLLEIRVLAEPSWDADQVHLTFWFIRDPEQPKDHEVDWNEYRKKWLSFIPKSHGRFVSVDGIVQDLKRIRASDYVESDLLDYDHLSSREP